MISKIKLLGFELKKKIDGKKDIQHETRYMNCFCFIIVRLFIVSLIIIIIWSN